ncbi:MAG TPA: hypothetical protein VGQ36_17615 [Thermoanaerobaculia bacterium]|nr:hypothetical protein [Thermoanaerobaculia bacterium]
MSTTAIPKAWMSVPATAPVAAVMPSTDGPIFHVNGRLFRGDKPVTDAFAAIDSFDYSESRDEVIFSAKKDASFDIGLAAGDGTVTNWLPADAADELAVQWAPRGNKVSFIVRTKLGDVVRTFHIPTSFQYVVAFGTATINSLTWDAPAERFAVVYSTLEASERTERLRYDGTDRRIEAQPKATIAADVVPFAADAFLFRPRDLRYGEKVPLVVWIADRFAWSDARAALMQNARVASIVVTRAPDEAFWTSVRATTWLDASKIYVVNGRVPDAISFVADASVPAGRYRRSGNVVAAAPAAIQSVAAGFIAEQVKRTSRTNGSSQ